MKKWKITIELIIIALVLAMSLAVCQSTPPAVQTTSGRVQVEEQAAPAQAEKQAAPAQPVSLFWTGDGGRGKSITILPPKGTGLANNQAYLPELVANELVSNLSKFSGMKLFDRINLQKQYNELLSGYYADNDEAGMDLGHLASTDYMLLGTITKTSTGFTLQLSVNSNADKILITSHSSVVTIADLDNLNAVRLASLELLEGLGIQPTERTKTELTQTATKEQANAQAALAQGMVAQKEGTVVQALSRYIQANTYDPSLAEAAGRLNILAANVSSGNIGENVRNDIQWRDQWVARLKECEEFYINYMKDTPPYYLVYSTNIKQGTVDYQKRTVPLTMESIAVYPEISWFTTVDRVVKTVREGLIATGRASVWGLQQWPQKSISAEGALFNSGNYYREPVSRINISGFWVDIELVNSNGKVIGRNTGWFPTGWFTVFTQEYGPARIEFRNAARAIGYVRGFTFPSVNADDITDNLTIRISTIDGINTQTAAQQRKITIFTTTDTNYTKKLTELKASIPDLYWYNGGSENPKYVILGDGSIIAVRNAVNSILDNEGPRTSRNHILIIHDRVTSIGQRIGSFNHIFIGANVKLWSRPGDATTSFGNGFDGVYNNNGRRAGLYSYYERNIWTFRSRDGREIKQWEIYSAFDRARGAYYSAVRQWKFPD